MATPKTKTLKITGCAGCPHVKTSPGHAGTKNFACWHPTQLGWNKWPGTKYPDERKGRTVAVECDFPREYPTNTFPDWCPL